MRWRFVLACGLAGGLVYVAGPQVVMSASADNPQVAGTTTTTSSSGGDLTSMSGMVVPEAALFGTGVISGLVTDGTTGLPVEGVFVQLSGGRPGPAGRPQQMTDGRGRFAFTHLVPASGYTVNATKLGYLDGGYRRVPGVTSTTPISLRDGEWNPKADVQLWKTSSISGTVLDDQNDPVVGVPVRVLMKVRVAGRARYAAGVSTVTDDRGMYRMSGLSPGEYIIHVPDVQVTMPEATSTPRPPAPSGATSASITSAAPDPDGVLRAEGGMGLFVGFFATPPAGGGAAAYAMAYHPAARSMDAATPVTLGYGDQRQGIDVQLTLLPTFRVSGRVLGPPGDGLAKMPIRLLPVGSESLSLGAEAALTTTDAQGAFTFLRVPSGDYTLIASRTMSEFGTSTGITTSTLIPRSALSFTSMSVSGLPGTSGVSLSTRSTGGDLRLSGRTGVSVGDRDVDDVAVPLVTGVTVSGHFLWDGAEAPANGSRVQPAVRLEPADGDLTLIAGRTTPRNPNEVVPSPIPLTLEGVLPGRYVFANISAGSFLIEAIEWRGRDLLTSPLEVEGDKDVTGIVIRMSSKPTLVTGSVNTANGPASGGAVIAFPAIPSAWRNFGLSALLFKTASILADGTFRLSQVIPGEYFLAAVPNEDRMKWTDPDYLASIAATATRVTVTPGSTVTQSLRMIGGGR